MRNDHSPRFGERIDDLHRRLRALRDDAVDFGAIVVESVMESHSASDDGRKGIMAHDNPEALPAQPDGNRRGDFICPENDRKFVGPTRQKIEALIGHVQLLSERPSNSRAIVMLA